jgi:hypothetical protein
VIRPRAARFAAKLDWSEFNTSKKDHETIEHIYPATPIAGEWPAFQVRSIEERALLLNSLGNLVAVSQSRNSKLSNRAFAMKKSGKDGVGGYLDGSYSERALARYSDWTPGTILERSLAMLDFLEMRWHLSLGTRAEKVKLLNLDFLDPPTSIGADVTV